MTRSDAEISSGEPRRARLPGIRRELADALRLYVGLRLAFGLVALYLALAGVPGPCHFELARNGWETIPPLADAPIERQVVGVWQRWDACWYGKIATYGYEATEDSAAFWPLFPALTGVLSRLLGGAVALAGLVVAGVAYVLAIAGLRRLVTHDIDRRIADRTVLLLSVFPSAFFLFAPFTEALFLAAVVWSVLGARTRRWGLAGFAALAASLTRIQGVFLVLPLAWEALTAFREVPPDASRSRLGAIRLALPGVAAAVLPIAGATAWIRFSEQVLGRSPLASQDAWGGREFHPPWETVAASWQWVVERGDALQLLNLVGLLGFLALVVLGVRRIPVAYSLLALPQLLLLVSRIQPTPLTSTIRYLLPVFPAFVVLALLLRSPGTRAAWLATSAMLLGILFAAFVRGDFVA